MDAVGAAAGGHGGEVDAPAAGQHQGRPGLLHRGRHRLDGVDEGALLAGRQAQDHRGDVAGRDRARQAILEVRAGLGGGEEDQAGLGIGHLQSVARGLDGSRRKRAGRTARRPPALLHGQWGGDAALKAASPPCLDYSAAAFDGAKDGSSLPAA